MSTVTDVSTTCVVVIFRVKVSCITSVDGIKLWLLTWFVNKSRYYWSSVRKSFTLLAMKTRNVIGAFRSAYCHSQTVVVECFSLLLLLYSSRLLSTLQQNRAKSRLLSDLFYDEEFVKFPTHCFLILKTNFIFKTNQIVLSMFYTPINHA